VLVDDPGHTNEILEEKLVKYGNLDPRRGYVVHSLDGYFHLGILVQMVFVDLIIVLEMDQQ